MQSEPFPGNLSGGELEDTMAAKLERPETPETPILPSKQNLRALSRAELLARIPLLAGSEREATSALVAHLAEMHFRRLYEASEYPTLYSYCMRVLHFS